MTADTTDTSQDSFSSSARATRMRETIEPDIHDFLADLTEFASGSYLREEEKEFWDQPFAPSALEELGAILSDFQEKMIELSAHGISDKTSDTVLDTDVAHALVETTVARIGRYNAAHDYAIIEPEEEHELHGIFSRALSIMGADPIDELDFDVH